MHLFLVRHADPDYARDALTPAGQDEARALGRRVAALSPTHLYASPLGRARETAAWVTAASGLEAVIEPDLAELDWHVEDGRWGHLSAWDVPGETVRLGSSGGAGEEFRKELARVHTFSDALFARHGYRREGGRYATDRSTDDRLVVVCHGGLGLTWLAHLLDLPLDRVWCGFWFPPSSITTVRFEERSDAFAAPRCIGLGDVSHLVAAGLPTSASGLAGRA